MPTLPSETNNFHLSLRSESISRLLEYEKLDSYVQFE
jgi:hypothetical protein